MFENYICERSLCLQINSNYRKLHSIYSNIQRKNLFSKTTANCFCVIRLRVYSELKILHLPRILSLFRNRPITVSLQSNRYFLSEIFL